MGQLVQVKLGEYRPVIWADANGVVLHRHDMVILEVERNLEFGKVISDPDKDLYRQDRGGRRQDRAFGQ